MAVFYINRFHTKNINEFSTGFFEGMGKITFHEGNAYYITLKFTNNINNSVISSNIIKNIRLKQGILL